MLSILSSSTINLWNSFSHDALASFLTVSKDLFPISRERLSSACSKLIKDDATLTLTSSPNSVSKPMIAPTWSPSL